MSINYAAKSKQNKQKMTLDPISKKKIGPILKPCVTPQCTLNIAAKKQAKK